jgi:hypothetical protein
MRQAGHVACVRGKKHTHRFRLGSLRERDHVKDLGIDERIISIQILKKYGGRIWTGLIWLRIGTSGQLLRTW